MSPSGDMNPNATRVISLIPVFLDSTPPLERPCSMEARIEERCLTMPLWSFTDAGVRGTVPRTNPRVEGLCGIAVGKFEDDAQTYFEVVMGESRPVENAATKSLLIRRPPQLSNFSYSHPAQPQHNIRREQSRITGYAG
jgi:hypothetical protein